MRGNRLTMRVPVEQSLAVQASISNGPPGLDRRTVPARKA
jgi:hypothetical protein